MNLAIQSSGASSWGNKGSREVGSNLLELRGRILLIFGCRLESVFAEHWRFVLAFLLQQMRRLVWLFIIFRLLLVSDKMTFHSAAAVHTYFGLVSIIASKRMTNITTMTSVWRRRCMRKAVLPSWRNFMRTHSYPTEGLLFLGCLSFRYICNKLDDTFTNGHYSLNSGVLIIQCPVLLGECTDTKSLI